MTEQEFFGPMPRPEYFDRLFCFDDIRNPQEVAETFTDIVNTSVKYGYYPTKADMDELGFDPSGAPIMNKARNKVRIIFQKISK